MDTLIQVFLGFIIIPWVTFVTVSIFSLKQEVAILKKTHDSLKDALSTIVDIFQNNQGKKKGR